MVAILAVLQKTPPPIFSVVPGFLFIEKKKSIFICSILVWTLLKCRHLLEGIIHQSNPHYSTWGFSNVFLFSRGIRSLRMDNDERGLKSWGKSFSKGGMPTE